MTDAFDIIKDKERSLGLKRERGMSYNPCEGWVAGHWYRVALSNFGFEFWLPHKLKGKELKEAALEFIGVDIYELEDIDAIWEIKAK